MRRLRVAVLGALAALAVVAATQPADQPAQVLRRYLAAFNRHDVEGVVATLHPDVKWISVMGDSAVVEITGRDSLSSWMYRYFAALPTVKSEQRGLTLSGAYASTEERVSWTTREGEPRAQSALSVYEVRGGAIVRVWYYPAAREPARK